MLSTLTLRQLKTALEQRHGDSRTYFPEANDPSNWKRIRDDVKHGTYWTELIEKANQLMITPAPHPLFSEFTLFGETGNRSIYETKNRELYAGLRIFSMLAMTDDNPTWITGLNNTIWSVCDQYTWVIPAHVGLYHNDYPNGIWDQHAPPRETVDLDAAYTALTLAEIISFLGDRLHPWVVHRAKEEIERRIFRVWFESPFPQNWELKTNNWPAVCSSNIGAAAIYIIKDSEKLAGMLWRVIGVLRNYFSGFDVEGATPEGPAYWQYGFSNFVYFAELLKERTQGNISLLADDKVGAISLFPQLCTLSGGKVVNFSDSPDEVVFHPGLLGRLQRYVPTLQMPPDTYRMTLNSKLAWQDATRFMLWTLQDETKSDRTQEQVATVQVQERIFKGNQWVISKVIDGQERMIAFAAKGGYNEEPHNHNDLGHFIVHVNGINVLADIGIGIYSKQYFQPSYRYELLNAGSHGHSVPIVNGSKQGFGRAYRSEILHTSQTEDGIQFVLDLTKAYECPSLERLTREFCWRRPKDEKPQLFITDSVQFSGSPTSYQEVFISSVQPEEISPGKIQMDTVILKYDSELWDLEVEPVCIESYAKPENYFYRLLLTCKKPQPEMVCEFQFDIVDQ